MHKNNVSIEINRHIFHILSGTVLALLFYFNLIGRIHFAILFAIGIGLFLIYKRFKIPIIHKVLLAMERKQNLQKFPGKGALFYMLGATLAVWIYPKEIATASILILAYGDGVAGFIRAFEKGPVKTWMSTIVSIATATIAARFIVPLVDAFTASLVVMLIERFDLKIDDNLFIPVIAGGIIYILG